MPKQNPENKLTDEEQFKRFLNAAKKAEVDQSGKTAKNAFKRLARKQDQASAKPKR